MPLMSNLGPAEREARREKTLDHCLKLSHQSVICVLTQ